MREVSRPLPAVSLLLAAILGIAGCASGGVAAPPVALAPTTTDTPAATTDPAVASSLAPRTTAAPTPTPAATPSPTPAPSPPKGRPLSTIVTFYAALDNDPPGSSTIAFPGTRHSEAGGTGTFDDPLTLASDPSKLKVGTIVYYPPLRKYFVMEDICASCTQGWQSSGTPHIDLWTGDVQDPGMTACERALTPDDMVTVELDAQRGRPVDPTPLYDADGGCAG
jgi:hypothetical protein